MSDARTRLDSNSLYQAVWRWHFIAGLLVLPFLVMMAITGGLYLFKSEIDRFVYRNWETVPARSQASLPTSMVIARVEAELNGQALQVVPPQSASESVKLVVRAQSGESQTVFADPYDGHTLGSTEFGGVMQLIRKIHSLQRFGFWASSLIEITAGWTIVLVIMGIFLWWPRGQSGGVVTIRGAPKSRLFWRDLHAVSGVFTAAILLFLAITGMPWSMFWGDHVQSWATARGLGLPNAPADVLPDWQIGTTMPATSTSVHAHHEMHDVPWTMEKAPEPASAASNGRAVIGVDRALDIFQRMGLRSFSVTLPSGPTSAYMAAYRPDRVEDTRVVYVDQYSGDVLADQGYAQYGAASKAIEWGIAVHQGAEYGAINRYLMLLGCIAIVMLAVSSVTMWWKRKPAGSWGVPPAPSDRRALRYVLVSIVVVGIIFPLVGLSLLVSLSMNYLFAFRRRTVGSAAT